MNPDGSFSDQYVICQVKAMQNLGRKPSPHDTVSAVYRVHRQREACVHWQEIPSETPITSWDFMPSYSAPSPTKIQVEKPPPDAVELQQQLLKKDQYITALQNENHFLREQQQQLRDELQQLQARFQSVPVLPNTENYFELLGVGPQHSMDEIKDAYRQRMKFYHPDRFVAVAQRLNQAFEVLTDPEQRRLYLQTYIKQGPTAHG